MKLWLDIINPSHPLLFHPIVNNVKHDFFITYRDRAETSDLVKKLDYSGIPVGKDDETGLMKEVALITRTISLLNKTPKYDYAVSMENPCSIFVTLFRRDAKSILFCDNDLKYDSKNIVQKLENALKARADYLIVPKCVHEKFSKVYGRSQVFSYDGLKEDIYYDRLNVCTRDELSVPFENFVLVRPESFSSLYVDNKESLVPELVRKLTESGLNVVLLPRDRERWVHLRSPHCYIPEETMNGLDLIAHADAVMTGSGTMAREAVVSGTKAVSFFPNDHLLGVDEYLCERGHMLHSRSVEEIVEYVINIDYIPYVNLNDVRQEVQGIIEHIVG